MPLFLKKPYIKTYSNLFIKKEILAKTILLAEGEIAKNAYFIEKGCIRIWFNDNGKDITLQFFFEGEMITSIESFKTNTPSLYSIETIEPCIAHVISKKNLILERLVFYQKLFLSRIKDKPQKRYEDLILTSPKIINRVPLQYISSFLGLTPVSLSRIRGRSSNNPHK